MFECLHLCVNTHAHTHTQANDSVKHFLVDGIDDAIKYFAKHLENAGVTNLKMIGCYKLSPNQIATLCEGLRRTRSLVELCIEYHFSPDEVRFIGLLNCKHRSILCSVSTLCSVHAHLHQCTYFILLAQSLYEVHAVVCCIIAFEGCVRP